jgi:hypothetical protein
LTGIRENYKKDIWNFLIRRSIFDNGAGYPPWTYETTLEFLREIEAKDHACETRRKNVQLTIRNYTEYGKWLIEIFEGLDKTGGLI